MNQLNEKQIRLRIILIARMESIDIKLLNLDPLHEFVEEHKSHGGYNLSLAYDKKGLLHMDVECTALELVNTAKCRHNNPETFLEDGFISIYQRK